MCFKIFFHDSQKFLWGKKSILIKMLGNTEHFTHLKMCLEGIFNMELLLSCVFFLGSECVKCKYIFGMKMVHGDLFLNVLVIKDTSLLHWFHYIQKVSIAQKLAVHDQ